MKRYRQEEKARQLEEWKQSGMTAWAYAKAKSLNPQTFNKWTQSGMKRQFVEIAVPIQERTRGKQEILIEKGEVKIHVPLGIGGEDLRTVIESLGYGL
jgi:hypothetical protein